MTGRQPWRPGARALPRAPRIAAASLATLLGLGAGGTAAARDEPEAPSEPVAPVEPEEPSEPAAQDKPDAPSEPAPVDPEEPSAPSDPSADPSADDITFTEPPITEPEAEAPAPPEAPPSPPAAVQSSRATPATAPPPTIDRRSRRAHQPASDLSPQHAALELRFGPYSPRIDDGTLSPVYEDFFGDGTRYFFGVEIDWQAWRAPYIGTLGVGVGWAYTSMSAPNRISGEEGPPSGPIAQESTLNIMPMYAVGVLRVDVLAREVGIPLVPYGKLGFGYALWWVNDGVSTASTDEGIVGRDTSSGTHMALGGMFLLDVLDPGAARAMDSETGINNSYLFFEWSSSNFDGPQMNVGSSNWVTGLAIEM